MEEREGGQSERDITLNIWEIGGGEHGLRATVAAAVTSALGFGVCCALGLRTRLGLSPFFTRRGESRKSVMLVSENCDNDLAA